MKRREEKRAGLVKKKLVTNVMRAPSPTAAETWFYKFGRCLF